MSSAAAPVPVHGERKPQQKQPQQQQQPAADPPTLVQIINSQVKAFLESPHFPVREPLKWVAALEAYVQTCAADDARVQQKREQLRRDQQQNGGGKKPSATLYTVQEERIRALQQQLLRNLCSGNIERHWLAHRAHAGALQIPPEMYRAGAWVPQKPAEGESQRSFYRRCLHAHRQRNNAVRPFRVQWAQAFAELARPPPLLPDDDRMATAVTSAAQKQQEQQREDRGGLFTRLPVASQASGDCEIESFVINTDPKRNPETGADFVQVLWAYLPEWYAWGAEEDLALDMALLTQELADAGSGVVPKQRLIVDYAAHQLRDAFHGQLIVGMDFDWAATYSLLIKHLAPSIALLGSLTHHVTGEPLCQYARDLEALLLRAAPPNFLAAIAETPGGTSPVVSMSLQPRTPTEQHLPPALHSRKAAAAVADDMANTGDQLTSDSSLDGGDCGVGGGPTARLSLEDSNLSEVAENDFKRQHGDSRRVSNSTSEVAAAAAAATTVPALSLAHLREASPISSPAGSATPERSPMPLLGGRARGGDAMWQQQQLTAEDAAHIIACVSRCSAVMVPEPEKTLRRTTATPKGVAEPAECFEWTGPLPYPFVVFRDPALGFGFRWTRITEDVAPSWCVVQ
jgi:hypothetical protein